MAITDILKSTAGATARGAGRLALSSFVPGMMNDPFMAYTRDKALRGEAESARSVDGSTLGKIRSDVEVTNTLLNQSLAQQTKANMLLGDILNALRHKGILGGGGAASSIAGGLAGGALAGILGTIGIEALVATIGTGIIAAEGLAFKHWFDGLQKPGGMLSHKPNAESKKMGHEVGDIINQVSPAKAQPAQLGPSQPSGVRAADSNLPGGTGDLAAPEADPSPGQNFWYNKKGGNGPASKSGVTVRMLPLPQKRAFGGPVDPGETFLVGEEGPELFKPSRGGRIEPQGGNWQNELSPATKHLRDKAASSERTGKLTINADTIEVKIQRDLSFDAQKIIFKTHTGSAGNPSSTTTPGGGASPSAPGGGGGTPQTPGGGGSPSSGPGAPQSPAGGNVAPPHLTSYGGAAGIHGLAGSPSGPSAYPNASSQTPGADLAKLGGTIGLRDNNPGNIHFAGQAGAHYTTADGGGLAAFGDINSGMRANVRQATIDYDKHGLHTVRQIMGRWTPSNPQAAANIASSMGVDPNGQIDLHNPQVMSKFMHALARQEHGRFAGQIPESAYNDVIFGQHEGRGGVQQETSVDTERKGKAMDAVSIAASKLGEGQYANASDVKEYLRTGGHGMPGPLREWCAAFVGSTLKQAGYPDLASNIATSYAKYGSPVQGRGQRGDVGVLMRGRRSGQTGGHVGILTGNYDPKRGYEMIAGDAWSRKAGYSVQREWESAGDLTLRRPPQPDHEVAASGQTPVSRTSPPSMQRAQTNFRMPPQAQHIFHAMDTSIAMMRHMTQRDEVGKRRKDATNTPVTQHHADPHKRPVDTRASFPAVDVGHVAPPDALLKRLFFDWSSSGYD